MPKFSKVWVADVIQDVQTKLAEASTQTEVFVGD